MSSDQALFRLGSTGQAGQRWRLLGSLLGTDDKGGPCTENIAVRAKISRTHIETID